jgi:hypothetical protein
MTSKGLGEMFEVDRHGCRKISTSVDGGPSGGSRVRAQTRERGPPSALAEITVKISHWKMMNRCLTNTIKDKGCQGFRSQVGL